MAEFTTRPGILGTFGLVTSTHWLATPPGMATLERGGNAFDAGVAAGFALQVVEPHLNGPGGDLPIILYSARTDAVEVICGQGGAPQAATVAAYRQLGLDLAPGTGLRGADRGGAARLVSRLRRRGDRALPSMQRGPGRDGPAASRAARGRRSGALAGHGRAAAHL